MYQANGRYAKSLKCGRGAGCLALAAGPYHRLTQIAFEFAITYAVSGQPGEPSLIKSARSQEKYCAQSGYRLEREKLEYCTRHRVAYSTLSFQTPGFRDPAALTSQPWFSRSEGPRDGRLRAALPCCVKGWRRRSSFDNCGTRQNLREARARRPGRTPPTEMQQLAALDAERSWRSA